MSASTLVFDWAPAPSRSRALVFFLAASFLLHGLSFYLFQVVYPPAITLLPPPARVSVLSADNPEAQALLRWSEAEDPALATTTQRPPDSGSVALPELAHIPSYATHQPELKTLPAFAPATGIPSAASAAVIPRTPFHSLAPLAPQKTAILFGEDLGTQGRLVAPEFKFRRSRPDAPANASFCVAVDGSGSVRFSFLQESSGDPALDEEASAFLRLCRFAPSTAGTSPQGDGLTWTTATILWGSDFLMPGNPAPSP